jgi:hypothetical protein
MNIPPSFRIPCGMGVESLWNPWGMRGESTSNVSTANLQPKKIPKSVDSLWIPCGFHMDSAVPRRIHKERGECKVLQKKLSNDAHIAYHVQTNTNKHKYLAHYFSLDIFCNLLDFYQNPIGMPDSYRILVKLDCKVLE